MMMRSPEGDWSQGDGDETQDGERVMYGSERGMGDIQADGVSSGTTYGARICE